MFSKLFQWRSLNTRVTLFSLLVFVLSIWSLAFYASRMLYKDMERISGEQQLSAVSFISAQIDSEFRDRIHGLELIARSIDAPLLDKPDALQAFLDNRFVLHSLFNGGTFITGMTGTAIASFPAATQRIGVNYMDRDAIAAALKNGNAMIGQPVLGKIIARPIFVIAVPIRDVLGQVIGAFAGVTDLSQPNFLDKITSSRYGKTGGYLLIAAQYRLVVTATDKRRIMDPLPAPGVIPQIDRFVQGFDGPAIFINPRGEQVLASAGRVPVAGWYVAAQLPVEEAFAPIHDMQRRLLLATLLVTFLAGALTWWMLKHQLAPIISAAKSLVAQSDTNLPTQPLPIIREDEIGQLFNGFNRLLATLVQREAFLKQILDTSSVAIFLVDAEWRITQANQRMSEMFGCAVDVLLGKEYVALIHPSEREAVQQKIRASSSSNIENIDLDRLYLRADGTQFWGHLTGSRFREVGDEKARLVGVIADISMRKQATAKLELAASVFANSREAIMITAVDGAIIDVNEAFTRITGYARDEVVGQNPRILNSGRQKKDHYVEMWRSLIDKGHWHGEVWNRRKSGEVYAELQTISTVRDGQGKPQQYVALFSDITSQKEHQHQLEHIAHYDALTSLPNRVLLADRLHQAMSQTQRRDQRLAVAYLDLDGFKAINDSHGHEAGDQLLMTVSTHMKHALREGDTLARLGGDEFVAVLLDLADTAASVPMLTRLLAAAAQPVEFGNHTLQVSASLGVTFYPQTDEMDADQLLRQADQAMYQAKLEGKNRYHFFDAEQDGRARSHHESIDRIARALAENEFVLHYQPKVNMRTGTVIGAEALIRWQHPEQGLLPPAAFLPDIEDHPMAVNIGEWVIDTALSQIERWQAGGLCMPISVNIGARQLQTKDFFQRLQTALAAHPHIQPSLLGLEVLETSALEDLAQVSQLIENCRQIGIGFALDDFGTGYSSLTYLKSLAVGQLKIDQTFVRDMLDDPDDLAILQGVLGLATAFRRDAIAEGVETVEHGELLLQLGCELAQGYGIARPMPADALPSWASAWQPDPLWLNRAKMSRDDLPLLFASIEHRAWIFALGSHLKGEREAPPLNHQACRFSDWLTNEGLARYGAHPAFATIDPVHRKIHALGDALCALHAQSQRAEALVRLSELYELRDTLLAQLKTLLRQSFNS